MPGASEPGASEPGASESGASEPGASEAGASESGATLSAEQRARAAASRQRARSLRAARAQGARGPAGAAAGGGGFLPEPEGAASAARAEAAPAPVADPAERPACLHCGRRIAHSYLFDTFGHAACDECRDDEGAHALLTRTEAKAEYLLRDEDLDSRGGALRCVRRRNPHAARGDMRLYLRAQVEARALAAWGGAARLAAERAARAGRRAAAAARRGARELRALRAAARSSLVAPARARHAHEYGPERHDAAADTYSRACACGHTETYEKM